ncbi:MAG: DUF4293 domain-containing protein [Bacteroidota bacterium]
MLQRIQTLFLLLAIIVNMGLIAAPLWNYQHQEGVEEISGMKIQYDTQAGNESLLFTETPFHIGLMGILGIATVFILVTIFKFSDRKSQIRIGYFSIITLMMEILLLVLLSQRGPYLSEGSINSGSPSWGFALPVVAIFLVWLAIRNIQKDEELIKSVDRIR